MIIALPHLGGWEWAGRWIADRGHPITVVVERIDPPELFEWFVDLRSKLGMTVVPLGPEAATTVMKALRDNHIVCLVSDRDLMGGGPSVDFFGERTTLPGGAATLALRTGAPIIPTGVYFTNRVDGHFAWVKPPIPVARESKRLREDVDRVTQLVAVRTGVTDPPSTVPVAPVPAQLAERPRVRASNPDELERSGERAEWSSEDHSFG